MLTAKELVLIDLSVLSLKMKKNRIKSPYCTVSRDGNRLGWG